MALEKPMSVANSPFRSAKWDEITEGRNFTKAQAPILEVLCSWYEVLNQSIEDITGDDGEIRVAYMNDMGDIKSMPQLSSMAKASAEIRQINKQLGINDEVVPQDAVPKENVLHVITSGRKSRAKDKHRAKEA